MAKDIPALPSVSLICRGSGGACLGGLLESNLQCLHIEGHRVVHAKAGRTQSPAPSEAPGLEKLWANFRVWSCTPHAQTLTWH